VSISDIPEITKLSTPEKILLVEDLWDSIASDESAVLVPQSHMKKLDRRLKRYGSPPGNLQIQIGTTSLLQKCSLEE
jgi:putative addiction module component (TIGR02574 family)